MKQFLDNYGGIGEVFIFSGRSWPAEIYEITPQIFLSTQLIQEIFSYLL
jgi:hypothetical protein